MMENKNKCFTNISTFPEIIVADHDMCDHYLKKEVK